METFRPELKGKRWHMELSRQVKMVLAKRYPDEYRAVREALKQGAAWIELVPLGVPCQRKP